MPRFYFHLHDDVVVNDEEGAELPVLNAARQLAFQSAAGIIGEQIAKQGRINPSRRIDVRNDRGHTVFTLRFADLVDF